MTSSSFVAALCLSDFSWRHRALRQASLARNRSSTVSAFRKASANVSRSRNASAFACAAREARGAEQVLRQRARAAAAYIAHNHPSGDPRWSDSDVRLTQRVTALGESLGLPSPTGPNSGANKPAPPNPAQQCLQKKRKRTVACGNCDACGRDGRTGRPGDRRVRRGEGASAAPAQ